MSDINLSLLPPPNIIEPLDYETILAQQKADLIGYFPECEPLLALESEPLVKQLRVSAYRELLMRQRVNEACRALLMQFAEEDDLDHIGVTYHHTARLLISAGDATVTPPVPAVLERDEDYRYRLSIAPSGYSVAGPRGAYEFHGLSASGEVKNIYAGSPLPGSVDVYVLSRIGDGTPSAPLLAAVDAALNSNTVRPMCDLVTVKPATIVTYEIDATLYTYDGVGADLAIATAQAQAEAYAAANHRIGYTIAMSGIDAALHVAGISRVEIAAPLVNITCGVGEAAYCTGINLTFGGVAR